MSKKKRKKPTLAETLRKTIVDSEIVNSLASKPIAVAGWHRWSEPFPSFIREVGYER